MEKAYVFIKKIPDMIPKDLLYPKERQEEIDIVTNTRVKGEKYWSWKLLEYGAETVIGKSLCDCRFEKHPCGKWICSDFCFSISHSGGYCGVIISDTGCGLDLEVEKNLPSALSHKILTENELSEFKGITNQEEQSLYLLTKWTQKEAIFKSLEKEALLPSSIETDDYVTETMRIAPDNTPIMISVFVKGNPDLNISFL